jgi:hypothetical protein
MAQNLTKTELKAYAKAGAIAEQVSFKSFKII